jgi:hypothetical protein
VRLRLRSRRACAPAVALALQPLRLRLRPSALRLGTCSDDSIEWVNKSESSKPQSAIPGLPKSSNLNGSWQSAMAGLIAERGFHRMGEQI